MNKPDFHGFGMEDYGHAKISLGKRRFKNYKSAFTRTLRGEQFEQPENENNLPLKINRKWNDTAR